MDKETKDRSTGIEIDQRVDKVAYLREWRKLRREHCNNHRREYRRREPEKHMVVRAKQRAQKLGIEFDLVNSDVTIPEYCPILGIKLEIGTSDRKAAPSLDRIDNTKGYIRGNVRVISNGANTIKSNLTCNQIIRMAEWIKEQSHG